MNRLKLIAFVMMALWMGTTTCACSSGGDSDGKTEQKPNQKPDQKPDEGSEETPEPKPEAIPGPSANRKPGIDATSPATVAKSLGLGWNLGNQFDAHNNGDPSETAWGNPVVTQTAIKAVAKAGFTTIRIPVTWINKVGPAPDYRIDAAWLNRVAEVVYYAESEGMNVILNIHHDGADSKYWLNIKDAATYEKVNEAVKAQLGAMWTQIAEKFKNKGNFLVFEAMNEIHDGGWGWGTNREDGGKQYQTLNEWNQLFVDAVRAVGGENATRYLGVPGYCTNPDLTMEHLVLPVDPANRLMVSVHCYDPYTYTLECNFSQWGHTAAAGKKESWGDENHFKTLFGKLKSTYIDKGIPVYIGEIGCVHRSNAADEAFRLYYLEYVCTAARTFQLAPVYWDNGSKSAGRECSGLFDRASGAFFNNAEEVVNAMRRGVYGEGADYSLDAVYKKAP